MIAKDDLRRMVIIRQFTDEMLDKMIPFVERLPFEDREAVFRQGDSAELFYMLIKGKVLLEQRLSDKMTVSMDAIKPGYSFGWSAMLRGDLRRVTFAHIDAIMDLAANQNTGARVDLPGLISAFRQSRRLVLKIMETPRQPLGPKQPPTSYRHRVAAEQCLGKTPFTLDIATGIGRLTFRRRKADSSLDIRGSGQQTAFFDIDQLTFPLVIRNYQPGDRLTPLGMSGTKTLKKLLSERRVNPSDRHRCPVLVSGGEIVWVPGHRRSEACIVNRQTRGVLEAKYALPDEK